MSNDSIMIKNVHLKKITYLSSCLDDVEAVDLVKLF